VKPVLVCAADIAHLPETRAILEGAFDLRVVRPATTEALVRAHPEADAYYAALDKRGISVLGLKDERELLDRITATAELAWALTLACVRLLPAAFDAARAGYWARDALRGHQLAYKTFGVVGCGRLGTMVADYARAFRMTVLGCDVRDLRLADVELVDFDSLLRRADVVSIHIHLTEENRSLFNHTSP